MNHGFLLRLAEELKGFKPQVVLIVENLPNEGDLNRSGFDGFAQWCDLFHDKIKALLREGPFEGEQNTPDGMGDVFFFSRARYAAHTNNAVNFCENHDENSVANEMQYTPSLNNLAAKDRKGRLGLFAAITALGQPMMYMGQEFKSDRPQKIVTVDGPRTPPITVSFSGRRGWSRFARGTPVCACVVLIPMRTDGSHGSWRCGGFSRTAAAADHRLAGTAECVSAGHLGSPAEFRGVEPDRRHGARGSGHMGKACRHRSGERYPAEWDEFGRGCDRAAFE